MSRPSVTVVMPFAGDGAAAHAALAALLALDTRPGDQLILADNSLLVSPAEGVEVTPATGERSPARARNAGAANARNNWILFLDADCRAPAGLIDAYFATPVADDVGALAGEVIPAVAADTLAARYGAARSFLGQRAHLEHPFRPRAVAANLLVRRAAFEEIGGFYEAVLAGEDTDFSWRLQEGGWRLELRPDATVEHRYRATLKELRHQWRGYAAGRAWLARRYRSFRPEPAVRRAVRRAARRIRGHRRGPAARRVAPSLPNASRVERGRYLALDALLSVEELAGLLRSNHPPRDSRAATHVVLVADRFPAREDPLVDYARTLQHARVEAMSRPKSLAVGVSPELRIDYAEDDGPAARALALAALALRHPLRCVLDALHRAPGEPKLSEIAAAARRVERDAHARVHALGSDHTRSTAERIARLVGRLQEPRRQRLDGARR